MWTLINCASVVYTQKVFLYFFLQFSLSLFALQEKEVRKWKEELLEQRRRMMDEKLLHAEFKRELQLQAIVKKAQEEEAKVELDITSKSLTVDVSIVLFGISITCICTFVSCVLCMAISLFESICLYRLMKLHSSTLLKLKTKDMMLWPS